MKVNFEKNSAVIHNSNNGKTVIKAVKMDNINICDESDLKESIWITIRCPTKTLDDFKTPYEV